MTPIFSRFLKFWQEEKITRMKIEGETKIKKYNIVFKKIDCWWV